MKSLLVLFLFLFSFLSFGQDNTIVMKIEILKNGVVTNSQREDYFESREKFLEWFKYHKEQGNFGKNAYIEKKIITEEIKDENDVIISEATYELIDHPAEYEVVKTDISAEVNAEKAKELEIKTLQDEISKAGLIDINTTAKRDAMMLKMMKLIK
jgi:hypothetical protein